MRKHLLAITAGALALTASNAMAGALLQYPGGSTYLGVNDQGHLNFAATDAPAVTGGVIGDSQPFLGGGEFLYGLFRFGVGDGTSPGCACEGWGASADFATQGFVSLGASVDNGGISGVSATGTFGSTSSTATSIVNTTNNELTVQHNFGPSIVFDVFQATVTITNNTTERADNVTYRRIMDWDIPGTPFDEFVTIQGVEANLVSNGGNVIRAVDNGFDSADPGFGDLFPINEVPNTDFVDSGPNDHGAGFDFGFGSLDPGESRSFNIFYGTAPTQASAEAAVNTLNLDVYSFGQSNPDGLPFDGGPCGGDFPPDECFGGGGEEGGPLAVATAVPGEANPIGAPATFIFGFQGVGGVEPGTTAETPILPIDAVPGDNVFVFENPEPGRWFDPPFVESYLYELEGDPTAFFSMVGVPPASFGFGPIDVIVDGMIVATLMPGEMFDFFANGLTDVNTFLLSGLDPLVDSADPGFATAFPAFLDFTGAPLALSITAQFAGPSTPTPEPAVLAMVGAGVIGLFVVRRRVR